ncbi:MAG: hypothetical protein IKW28_10865 [Lachnospiraceae bacterium]|nr:hypothetical protein [Lachnospiraceae bacterium]
MIRVEAIIRLSKDITIASDKIKTGFRVTIKVGNKGYITQLFAIEGQDIPLEKETNVYMDILYGELDIEKFINNFSFDFVSGKKLGEGRVVSIREICIENDAFDNVTKNREKEIMSILDSVSENYKIKNKML